MKIYPFLQFRRYSKEMLAGVYGTPCAADILYKNPEAMRNRLNLYHLYRLQRQAELDYPKLSEMRMPKPEIDDTKEYLRISYKCLDNHPGIESQFVPEAGSVTVTFRPEKLGLSEEQLELLLKLAFEHYDPDLREQNEKKALTIVKNLMDYVKNDANEKFADVPLVLRQNRRRKELEFPKEWLPNKLS